MLTIPKGWLAWKTNEGVYLETPPVPGLPSGSRRNYDHCYMEFANAKPFGYSEYCNTSTIKDAALHEECRALDEIRKTINKEEEQLITTLKGLIDPIGSDSKLIAVWPDAVKYMPATDSVGDMAPAILGSEVNAMIATLGAKRP